MDDALNQISELRASLAGETYLSSSRVQNRLLDLWSELRDTPAAARVERWLTLSIERELFSTAELVEFLDELAAYVGLVAGSLRLPSA